MSKHQAEGLERRVGGTAYLSHREEEARSGER